MADFDIEEVIREASYKNKKGYIDIHSIDDVKFLENIMYEMKYPSDFIDEYVGELAYENVKKQIYRLVQSDLNEGIIDSIRKFISASWVRLKSFINTAFNKASAELSTDDKFEKEYTIIIPTRLSEHMDVATNLIVEAGKIEAMKGYYNEALVCQKLWEYTGDKNVVNMDTKKYKSYKDTIDSSVKRYRKEIADKKVLSEVDTGSEAMFKYLVNSAKIDGVVIVGAFLSGMEKSVGEKKDISIVVKRGMNEEEVQNYSLKLYSGLTINMTNMTMLSIVYNLTNPSGVPTAKGANRNEYTDKVEKMQDRIKQKTDAYRKSWDKAIKLNKDMKALKKIDKDNPKIQKLRDMRNKYRNILNPVHAEIVYKIFKDFVKDTKNKKIFVRNLLQSIGFSNSDTRMLLAIMKNKNDNKIVKQLIDEHPEFDLSDINLKKTSNITIRVHNRDEIIVKFDFKEGEQKAVSGRVVFSKVTPVSPDFWQDLI